MKESLLIVLADYKPHSPDSIDYRNHQPIQSYINFGYNVMHVVASEKVHNPQKHIIEPKYKLILRPNIGYDFGSWGQAIQYEEELKSYKNILFVNSSLLGPFSDPTPFITKMLSLDCDIKAAVVSHQVTPHFQSHFWAVDSMELLSTSLKDFFLDFIERPIDRQGAIQAGELRLPSLLGELGLTFGSLFPAGSLCELSKNPTLDAPIRLIANGFPYFKKSLLPCLDSNESLRNELKKVVPNFAEMIDT
jgi:lipopolysaccharide biosynthesis protein